MTVSTGAPRLPVRARPDRDILTMTNSDKQRAKRGVLSTGRARKLEDADADADDDDEQED